jgi:hypothetical protein
MGRPLAPARLAGWVFQAGNSSLLAIGGCSMDWSELAGSASFIASAEILRRRGDDPAWFPMIRDTVASRSLGMAFVITLHLIGEALVAVSGPDAVTDHARQSAAGG